MANSDKNILITPSVGAATGTLPTIRFTGADNTPITMRVLDSGTLSYESSSGQLFSVSSGLTGSIFSVNDISGIPSIEVLDTGLVKLAQYNGQVTIGTGSAAGTAELTVVPSAAANLGLVIKGFASQSVDLQQWQNSTGAPLAYISPNGSLALGQGAGAVNTFIEIGNNRSADGNAFIDLVSDTTYTDYGLRIIRSPGANGASGFTTRGTGGIYLTTIEAGPIQFNTANTTRMTIASDGTTAIGTGVSTFIKFTVGGTIGSSSNSSYSIQSSAVFPATATAVMRNFYSLPSTEAATYTAATFRHFDAGALTLGAGTTLTEQVGFRVGAMTEATNNYGFYGGIAAGTNRYNLYMAGTAWNYFAGPLGIGSTSLTSTNLRIGKTLTGSTAALGVLVEGQIQSDVTSEADLYVSFAQTAASAFTVGNIKHFWARQGTIGATSSVTNQYGFIVENTLTGATNLNIGFYGDIASGTGRYNLYMNGTAANYLAGDTTFAGQIISTRANATGNGAGQIYLNGATGNRIDFNQNGVAAPAFTTRSIGAKIVLYPDIGASQGDYAIGVENSNLWFSTPLATNTRGFKWYGGTTNIATLTGAAEFTLNSTSGTLGNNGTTANTVTHQFGVVSGAATNVVQVIRAASLQTGDLAQWQNSSGGILARISSIGQLFLTQPLSLTQGQGITWNNGDSYITGISGYHIQFTTYNGVSGQNEVMRITGGSIASGGARVGIGATSPSSKLQINTAATGEQGLIIRGFSGQTANLQEWQDSNSNILVKVTSAGVLDAPFVINPQTTSYTLVLADAGKMVEVNNGSPVNVTIPGHGSVAYPVGTQIHVLQTGAGQVTFVAGAGAGTVTINGTPGLKLRAQWSSATLIKRSFNAGDNSSVWVAIGDLSA